MIILTICPVNVTTLYIRVYNHVNFNFILHDDHMTTDVKMNRVVHNTYSLCGVVTLDVRTPRVVRV